MLRVGPRPRPRAPRRLGAPVAAAAAEEEHWVAGTREEGAGACLEGEGAARQEPRVCGAAKD